MNKEELALQRYREFYYENQDAKNYVTNLINQGYLTPEALKQMRKQFAQEYFNWKIKKGYKESWTDMQLLKEDNP